ncbi:MAG: alpha-E domain-containing protein [Candidatus Melainabacteria bacterium]|jgi:uncharacterized alpha-E superfamily protein|nr:alpha-E domain-containing protein [Candidatus Melainabacteria bacterium]
MLSRVAGNIFWMQRYRERVENMARLIEVNFNLNIDIPESEKQWEPLLRAVGAAEEFQKHYQDFSRDTILDFLTFDLRNPGSIFSCLIMARENARSIREIITSDMWHEINTLYLFLQQSQNQILNHHNFYSRVKRQCQLFTGISDSTLSHGRGWHFGRVGYLLERADMGSRLLDVKYFTLLSSPDLIGSPFDNIQWNALLDSMSALEMYRQKWQQIKHVNVAEFLILDRDFPRSLYSCINRATDSLLTIVNTGHNPHAREPYEISRALLDRLEAMNGESIISYGLHEYLDKIQKGLLEIGKSINSVYFSTEDSTKDTQKKTIFITKSTLIES